VPHAYPLSCVPMRREVHEERLGRFIAPPTRPGLGSANGMIRHVRQPVSSCNLASALSPFFSFSRACWAKRSPDGGFGEGTRLRNQPRVSDTSPSGRAPKVLIGDSKTPHKENFENTLVRSGFCHAPHPEHAWGGAMAASYEPHGPAPFALGRATTSRRSVRLPGLRQALGFAGQPSDGAQYPVGL
jgi:hypothetical protein